MIDQWANGRDNIQMLTALHLAIKNLSDENILVLLIKSIALTLAIFLMIGCGLWFGIDYFISDWLGEAEGWIATTIAVAAILVTILTGWFLFRVVAITVMWFFADDIVEAIELKNYPKAAETGIKPGFQQSFRLAMRSLLRVVGYNLAVLPFYLILLASGIGAPITPFIFLIVNSLLLGRDLEDMLAARHGTQPQYTDRLIKRGPKLLLGFIGTAGMMVPIVNFLVPVIATAMAVHMLHLQQKTRHNIQDNSI